MSSVAVYSTLVPVTGDHASALVLSYIIGWHTQPKKGIRWMGVDWLVQSRAAFCQATAITLDQYKRIIPKLIRQGWIHTERHLFHDKVRAFMRLTPKGETLISPSEVVKISRLVASPTKPCNIYTTESTEVQKVVPVLGKAQDANTIGSVKAGEKGEKVVESVESLETEGTIVDQIKNNIAKFVKGLQFMKAADIVKQGLHLPGAGLTLGAYWKSRCALVSNGYQQNLTGKEHGQLKALSKQLGDQTRPIIAYAVEHWTKFASQAALVGGTSWPTDPHIGFLLKYHAVAVDLLYPPAASCANLKTPVQSIAPVVEDDPPYVPTAAELAVLLAGLKTP